LFEVEPGEVHVASGEDADREEVFAGGEVEFDKVCGEVPVVPLAPGERIGLVEGGLDGEGPSGGFAVEVE